MSHKLSASEVSERVISFDFRELRVKNYPRLWSLLGEEMTLEDLPDEALQALLQLTQDHLKDPDSLDDNPLELLSVTGKFLSYHMDLVNDSPRILSFDEQRQQQIDSRKSPQELSNQDRENRQSNRHRTGEMKRLRGHFENEQEFDLLLWATSLANSSVTKLSVDELLNLDWKTFIEINNRAVTIQSLQAVEEYQREQERQKQENQKSAPPRGIR